MSKTGKGTRVLAAVAAAFCLLTRGAFADTVVTLTFTGDCTIGSWEKYRDREDSFDAYAERNGTDYFFANFRDMFSADDCTVINLEGVLSDQRAEEKINKTYRFRGQESFVRVLTDGSVELAGIANNHILDYSAAGMNRTIETLEAAGIGWARASEPYILEKDGIRVYFFAVDYGIQNDYGKSILKKVTELKESAQANAIVIMYHNGNEYDARHDLRQERVGNEYIDAGADLVVMHHPHVVQGIRIRKNRTIFYSLGNFVFGGNPEIRTAMYRNTREVTALYALVPQVKLHFSDDGQYIGQQAILYPAYTSATAPQNNYQPFRLTAEQAEPVIDAIRFDTPETEIPALSEDETGFVRVIMPYLNAGTNAGTASSGDGAPEAPPARPDRNHR